MGRDAEELRPVSFAQLVIDRLGLRPTNDPFITFAELWLSYPHLRMRIRDDKPPEFAVLLDDTVFATSRVDELCVAVEVAEATAEGGAGQ